MSFGSAVRFQVAPDQGKPSIFWHKDAAQKKTRKFGYKNKELRYPIRKPVEEPEPEIKPAELERQKNKTDFIKRNREKAKGKEAEKKEHPAANTVTLTQDQLNAILASVGRLSSGKENGLRISIDPDSSEIQIDKATKGGQDGEGQGKEERGAKEDAKGGSKGGPDLSIYSFVNGQLVRENTMPAADPTPSITREPPLEASKEMPKTKEESKTVTVSNGAVPPLSQVPSTLTSPRKAEGLPFVVSKHMTVAERKRLQWARERAEMAGETDYDPWGRPGAGAPLRGADGNILSDYNTRKEEVVRKSQEDSTERALRNARQQQASQSTRPPLPDRNAPLPTSDPQPLTNNFMFGGADRKVSDKEEQRRRWVEELDKQREEKRLQKMKEKEWLRGGPDTGSQPVSTMQQQHQQQQLLLQQQLQQQQLQQQQQQQLLQQQQQQQQQLQLQLPKQQQQQQQQSSSGQSKETPAAMRSSFVIGQLAPNETRFDNTKAEEKKKWLAELEKQMEEKRQKKLSEKQRDLGQLEDTWADRLSYPEPKQQPDLPITALTSNLSPRVPFPTEKEDTHRVNSAPLTASQTLAAEENKSYIRGQNVYIDPVTRQELSDKRQRHMELQDALKAQIDEKKRLKDLEREKVRLEEMAEEQRLKAEQARIQLQYQQDQQKLRQKEEQRQSKIDDLKSKMDEAQEAAAQERMLRRLQALKDGGHDVSHLKAHYDAPEAVNQFTVHSTLLPVDSALSPRTKVVAPTQVPGLSPRDLGGGVAPQLHGGPYVHAGVMALRDSVEHQPYVENRVLTPSRYRHPSLPHTDPSSPKREFGTQTIELRRPSSGVEIEYQPRPGDQEEGARAGRRAVEEGARTRKTTKAAAARDQRTKGEPGRRPQPPKPKEEAKPKGPQVWNYNNQRHKKPVKQSERDPHFEQRKREREERKAQREQQLLALVEANKHAIPGEKPSGSHSRRAVEDRAGPGPRAGGHRGGADDLEDVVGASRMTSYHDHIPHILSPAIQELTEPELNLHPNQARSPAPHHHQPGSSPPVPSVRHRGESQFDDRDLHLNTHRSGPPMSHVGPYTGRSRVTHYDDLDPLAAPDGDFVPFMRTSEVLDPARAAEPLQVSRENTRVLNARNAYLGSRNPGSYGQTLSMYDDPPSQNSRTKDPILNPELVKGHPTARQDAILAQLSTLKQSLIQRQREIETYMEPPALEPQ